MVMLAECGNCGSTHFVQIEDADGVWWICDDCAWRDPEPSMLWGEETDDNSETQ